MQTNKIKTIICLKEKKKKKLAKKKVNTIN